jgi:hypothetical protein
MNHLSGVFADSIRSILRAFVIRIPDVNRSLPRRRGQRSVKRLWMMSNDCSAAQAALHDALCGVAIPEAKGNANKSLDSIAGVRLSLSQGIRSKFL